MASILHFGANAPIVVDEAGVIVDGHAVFEAMLQLGYTTIPVLTLSHLSEEQLRLYRIAVNKLSEGSKWDPGALKLELIELQPIMLAEAIEPEALGLSTAQVDLLTLQADEQEPEGPYETPSVPVTREGDMWLLGDHRLLCGDALSGDSYDCLMGSELARMAFTDPPYNVAIAGNVSGKGQKTHREFAMASGEMSRTEFAQFIKTYMGHLARVSVDGAIHFHCMDWRHIAQVYDAGEDAYGREPNQLIVWVKSNAGMGTFYRSQHELIAVFKVGTAPHLNTFQLGQTGRYRTNCWHYDGVNGFRAGRDDDLNEHPTVKPTALVMDAIKDVSHQGDLVLDCFAGSGTTILAAEKTKRRARAIELDPVYVDVAIRRWQTLTGEEAILEKDGQTFGEVAVERREVLGHD